MNLNESSAVMWKTRFIFVSHTTLFSKKELLILA